MHVSFVSTYLRVEKGHLLPADTDGNGGVNVLDLNTLGLNWGESLPAGTPGGLPFPAVAAAISGVFDDGSAEDDDSDDDDLMDSILDDVASAKKKESSFVA